MADFLIKEKANQIRTFAKRWFEIDHVWHAVCMHQNKSVEELRKRKLKLASTFLDVSQCDIWKIVTDMIEDGAEEIAEWLEDRSDWAPYGLYLDDAPVKGIVLVNGKEVLETSSIICILKKKGNAKFRISTAFPFHPDYEPAIDEE